MAGRLEYGHHEVLRVTDHLVENAGQKSGSSLVNASKKTPPNKVWAFSLLLLPERVAVVAGTATFHKIRTNQQQQQ